MKLYHVDRIGHLKVGQEINLITDFYNETTQNEYFQDGLSGHGMWYYLADSKNNDHLIDAVFEYERMINFPDKLSRYQAMYAFAENGVVHFIEKKDLEYNFYKIYEVEAGYYEKYNFNLVRGWSHCMASKYAKLYWANGEDLIKKREPVYEYLLKMPVKVIREVQLSEIKDQIKKQNKKVNKKKPKE
jgi:hypothetical protein